MAVVDGVLLTGWPCLCDAQAVTPQLLAAHAKASDAAVRHALLECLQRLEGAAPAAVLYPVLVEMRCNQQGDHFDRS